MKKIPIKKLEDVTGYKVKQNHNVVGYDLATRSGICFIETSKTEVKFDWMFIEFKGTGNTKEKYRTMVRTFADVVSAKTDLNVIEDTYLSFFGNKFAQAEVFKQLSRYGGFLISESVRKNVPYEIIGASSSRSKLGVKTAGYGRGNSKLAVADWLRDNLQLDLDDNDISDAIVLAILGILQGMDFKAKAKTKKKSTKKRKKNVHSNKNKK